MRRNGRETIRTQASPCSHRITSRHELGVTRLTTTPSACALVGAFHSGYLLKEGERVLASSGTSGLWCHVLMIRSLRLKFLALSIISRLSRRHTQGVPHRNPLLSLDTACAGRALLAQSGAVVGAFHSGYLLKEGERVRASSGTSRFPFVDKVATISDGSPLSPE